MKKETVLLCYFIIILWYFFIIDLVLNDGEFKKD